MLLKCCVHFKSAVSLDGHGIDPGRRQCVCMSSSIYESKPARFEQLPLLVSNKDNYNPTGKNKREFPFLPMGDYPLKRPSIFRTVCKWDYWDYWINGTHLSGITTSHDINYPF
jgi:hypothetical protein